MGLEIDSNGRSFYLPTAFFISLSDGVIDRKGKPTGPRWTTFLHEYAHLLQDRCTIYGAIEFIFLLDSMTGIINIINTHDAETTLPLSQMRAAEGSWIHTTQKMRATTSPRNIWEGETWWAFEEFITENQTVFYDRELRNMPLQKAKFVNNETGEECFHTIGPWEIKECYSVMVQRCHGDQPIARPTEFEYLAVERVLQSLDLTDPRKIIAICHWSLQDPMPGNRLAEIYDLIRETDHVSMSPEEIYDVLRERAFENRGPEKTNEIERQFEGILSQQAREGEFDHLYSALEWYKNHAFPSIRKSFDLDRRFPLDTFLTNKWETEGLTEKYNELVLEEPIPLYRGANGEFFKLGGLNHKLVFLLVSLCDLLFNLYLNKSRNWPCLLFDGCACDCRDASCRTQPYRMRDSRPTCPYGLASIYLRTSEYLP